MKFARIRNLSLWPTAPSQLLTSPRCTRGGAAAFDLSCRHERVLYGADGDARTELALADRPPPATARAPNGDSEGLAALAGVAVRAP